MSADAAPTFIRGVPHPLPAGERLLWEGAPNPRAVARHVFKGWWIAAYFAVMLLLWAFTTSVAFGTREYLTGLGIRVMLVAIVLGIIEILAQVVARTTVYAITDRRVVLRIGMVIPMSINIPFSLLVSASVAAFRDGTGQVLLELSREQRIAYIALWPHCRAFTFAHPQPLLRGLLEPKRIGELLASAVADAAERANAELESGGSAAPDASNANASNGEVRNTVLPDKVVPGTVSSDTRIPVGV